MGARVLRLLFVALCVTSAALEAWQSPVTFQQVSITRVRTTGVFYQRSGHSVLYPAQLRISPDGRVEARSTSLVDLARLAYGFEDMPAEFAPSSAGFWTSSDRFDVTATTKPPLRRQLDGYAMPPELRVPIQQLLEERFALKARIDTRRMHAYALRPTRSGKVQALRRSSDQCLGPFTDEPVSGSMLKRCPLTMSRTRIVAGAVTMSDFARVLNRTGRFSRIVVEETGLTGTYDIAMTVVERRYGDEAQIDDLVELRQALRGQLGLDLHEISKPMPVLVIEGAKRPVELK